MATNLRDKFMYMKGASVAFKNTAMFAIVGLSMLTVVACSNLGTNAAGGVPAQDAPLVEASLTDGTFLTCSEMSAINRDIGGPGYSILDCDWRSQRTEHDSDLQTIGPFQIVQKRFQNGKTYGCLSFVVRHHTIENCDWDRPLQS